MIVVGGENLIDYVQVSEGDDLPVYRAIPGGSCYNVCLLYTSPSPRDISGSRMPSSA